MVSLWKIMRHYGIPPKIVNIIRKSYQGTSCRIVHKGKLTRPFEIKTGVKQGCLLSPFLFLLAMDWIMKTSTHNKRNGIQWTLTKQLDDLDFADDLALLSHSHHQMQKKTTAIANTSKQIGLSIHKGKSKIMKLNTLKETNITLEDDPLGEVTNFVYLGSVIDIHGGTEADIRSRIGKARASFIQLRNIWRSKTMSRKTKLKMFNSNVKSVLLYGAESWRKTKTNMAKI